MGRSAAAMWGRYLLRALVVMAAANLAVPVWGQSIHVGGIALPPDFETLMVKDLGPWVGPCQTNQGMAGVRLRDKLSGGVDCETGHPVFAAWHTQEQVTALQTQVNQLQTDQQSWYQSTLAATLTRLDNQTATLAKDASLRAALVPQIEQALAQDPGFAETLVTDKTIQQQLLGALARQLATNPAFIAAVAHAVASNGPPAMGSQAVPAAAPASGR